MLKMMCSTSTRSSLELMLDSLRQKDEQLTDEPPALPIRPVSKARLPSARRGLRVKLEKGGLKQDVKENEARNKEDREPNFNKIELLDDTRERSLERILEIQKFFRGHQARCYYLQLKGGAITLQSFVRGEKSRKDYQALTRRVTAVVVIQQHMKKWIEWRTMQHRHNAVTCLQSVIRGWLTRRSLTYKENLRLLDNAPMGDMRKQDLRDPKAKDYIQVSPSALADLQRQLLRAETKLGQKEEENAALRQQIQQFDKKWSQYELKMTSLEMIWQDQLTSLQMSLAAANKSLASECTTAQPETFDPSPINHCYGANNTMPVGMQPTDRRSAIDFSILPCGTEPQQINNRLNDINQYNEQSKKVFHDNICVSGELKSVHLASKSSPDDEFRKLKIRFEAWKKDYKIRLQETLTMLQKLGHSETKKKSRKKWWGK